MKNKFNVGDFVKGNEFSSDCYGWTNKKMTKGVITDVYDDENIEVKILEREDNINIGSKFRVNSKYFDLIEQPDSIKIFRSSKATICEVKSNNKRLSKGVAKCCHEDEYDFIEGSKIALDRADANLRV